MFEFWLSSLHTCGNVLFNTSCTSSYYVENDALLCDVTQSWKIILGGHEKVWEPCVCLFSQLLSVMHCSSINFSVKT